MERRRFLSAAAAGGVGAGAAALARPAIGQSMPDVKWRMASSFPKSLPTLFGDAELISSRVAAKTESKFQICPFAAGETMRAAYKTTFEVSDEIAAKNANFDKLYGSFKKFHDE